MYGIVNKAIEDLVIANFGEAKWDAIKEKSGIDIDYFISNEPYDDDVTYKLAGAASEVLGISVNEVLIAFGEWWVLHTVKEKYGGLMDAGGSHFMEFMKNLPNFHNRIMLMYPKLTPPEFTLSEVTETSLNLHYYSKRPGLQEFVRGLIQGLGKSYNTAIDIKLLKSREVGDEHEVFGITLI